MERSQLQHRVLRRQNARHCLLCVLCSDGKCSMPDDHEHGLDMSSAQLASSAKLHRL